MPCQTDKVARRCFYPVIILVPFPFHFNSSPNLYNVVNPIIYSLNNSFAITLNKNNINI